MKKLFLLLIFTFQFNSFVFAQNEARYEQMADTADQEILYGNYKKAIGIYKELIKKDYEKSRMYSQVGMCYFYLKDYP